MEIREFRETDKVDVISLWSECGLVVPWNDPAEDIERKLKVDRDLFMVGHDDNELVATVMGGYEGHRGWINYLAVKPSSRRKGHGQKIMQAVEDRIKSRGCPKINLQIRAGNAGVAAFYEAIGYGTDDVIGMGKRL
jgi:ribosomal protein S18 acetylase RimI-like enzyme